MTAPAISISSMQTHRGKSHRHSPRTRMEARTAISGPATAAPIPSRHTATGPLTSRSPTRKETSPGRPSRRTANVPAPPVTPPCPIRPTRREAAACAQSTRATLAVRRRQILSARISIRIRTLHRGRRCWRAWRKVSAREAPRPDVHRQWRSASTRRRLEVAAAASLLRARRPTRIREYAARSNAGTERPAIRQWVSAVRTRRAANWARSRLGPSRCRAQASACRSRDAGWLSVGILQMDSFPLMATISGNPNRR